MALTRNKPPGVSKIPGATDFPVIVHPR